MDLLVIGMVMWITLHLLPISFRGLRDGVVAKIGLNPYKGLFSLGIVGSVALMVFGWQSIDGMVIFYEFGHAGRGIGFILIAVGFILMAAARIKSNIQRMVRHPELTGFALWALAHCIINGDLQSLVLFGGFLIWSLTSIVLINKRDGDFVKPEKQPFYKSIIPVAVGLVLVIVLVKLHPYFAGVPVAS